MSVLNLRRRAGRPAPRHSVHAPRPVTPTQAAAHADAFHGRDSSADRGRAMLRAEGTRPYPEPDTLTAGSAPWAGAQDPAMQLQCEDPDLNHDLTALDLVAHPARPYVPAPPRFAEDFRSLPVFRKTIRTAGMCGLGTRVRPGVPPGFGLDRFDAFEASCLAAHEQVQADILARFDAAVERIQAERVQQDLRLAGILSRSGRAA